MYSLPFVESILPLLIFALSPFMVVGFFFVMVFCFALSLFFQMFNSPKIHRDSQRRCDVRHNAHRDNIQQLAIVAPVFPVPPFDRYRTYNKKKHVTTSPYTGIKVVAANENVVVPADFTGEEDSTKVLFVKKIESVAVVNAFSKCTTCGCKVKEGDVQEKLYTCTTCHMNFRNKCLLSDFIISVTVVSGDESIALNIPKCVAEMLAEGVAHRDNMQH